MDISAALLAYSAQCQNQNQKPRQNQHWWSGQSWASDYSMLSPEAASPTSSVGCEFSSPCSPCGSRPGAQCGCLGGHCVPVSTQGAAPARRNRTRNPSKQRRNASEKEKLRMRDLTKALHHLRTYLPPSLAPAGQTLTKIQILRLAVRHIARLSAQLEPAAPCVGAETGIAVPQNSPEIHGRFHCTSASELWACDQSRARGLHVGWGEALLAPQRPLQFTGLECGLFGSVPELSPQDSLFCSSPISFPQSPEYTETAQSCQMYSKDIFRQMIPEDFWI